MMFFQFFSHLANLPPVMFSELTVLCNLEATNCTETAFYLTMLSSPIQFLVKLHFTFVFPFQTRKMFCCKVLTAFATVGITHFCTLLRSSPPAEHLVADSSKGYYKSKLLPIE